MNHIKREYRKAHYGESDIFFLFQTRNKWEINTERNTQAGDDVDKENCK